MRRTLIFSLIAIILLFAICTILSRVASKKVEVLIYLVQDLPQNINDIPQSNVKSIINVWEKHRRFLSLFVKKDYIITADLAVHTLEFTSIYGTECEYLCAKGALMVSLETLYTCLGLSPSSFL